MTTKVVCRLFDAQGAMVGFAVHEAVIRGDGMVRAAYPVVVPIAKDATVVAVSWHWADVNVEARVPFTPRAVRAGELLAIAAAETPLIVCGPMPGPLPPVTLCAPVAVGVPMGQLGARGAA